MQISPEALDKFRRIYKEEYGEEITLAEATDMAYRVMALYRLLARKPPNEDKVPPGITRPGAASPAEDRPPA